MEDAERNHDENMIKILQSAKEVNLNLNSKKLKLRSTSVKCMGHVIGKDDLTSDPDKVKAVQGMPKLTNKEVVTLLGFVNYLPKFLPRLSLQKQLYSL